MHDFAGELIASPGSSSASIVTPPDSHFVSLNPSVALPSRGVKTSVPIHKQIRQTEDSLGYERAGDIRRMLCPWLTSHRCSVDAMADLLAMNRRTFDRRLKSRGTSSRALANEIRFEVACRLLTDTEMSLSQVAAALGYSQGPCCMDRLVHVLSPSCIFG